MTVEESAAVRKKFAETEQKYSDTCYRMADNDGHYRISGLSGDVYGRITAEIVHGRDSYFPGVLVFGVDPSELVPCNCGKWEPPTKAQLEQTRKEMDGYRDLYQKHKARLN